MNTIAGVEDIAGLLERMPEHRAVIESLVRPFAAMAPAGQPTRATQSCVGGCPFLPEGVAWPTYGGDHMSFLVQVDFAEVPPLPGFPTSGLLQWFVASAGNYGMTYDETAGSVGFEARWYDGRDLTLPSQYSPGEALPFSPRIPGPAGHGGRGRAVAFTLEDGVPSREEIDSLDVPSYRRLGEADPDWEIYDSDDHPQPYGPDPRSAATRTRCRTTRGSGSRTDARRCWSSSMSSSSCGATRARPSCSATRRR